MLGNTLVTGRVIDRLALIVVSSGIVSDTEQEIRENVGKWRRKGLRYAKLSDLLDNGVPFLLPGGVIDTT